MVAKAKVESSGRKNGKLGVRGEDVAVAFLKSKRLTILQRNWRCRAGELDIIATDGEQLIVCEVKTRSGTGFGTPAEAVIASKADRIRRLTQAWLAEFSIPFAHIRFDVVSVLWPPGGDPAVDHIEGAF
jgi:putative endonuclease